MLGIITGGTSLYILPQAKYSSREARIDYLSPSSPHLGSFVQPSLYSANLHGGAFETRLISSPLPTLLSLMNFVSPHEIINHYFL